MRKVFLLTMAAGLMALPALALAADPTPSTYAPGSSTPTTGAGPHTATQDGGSHVLGEQFTREACGFAPGSTATITADGQAAGTKAADANGCVSVTVKVLSTTQSTVNGVTVNTQCGTNSWVATGSASGGSTASTTENFTVSCASTAAAGTAFTGANILRWTLVALALIAVGAVLVMAERRRTQAAA